MALEARVEPLTFMFDRARRHDAGARRPDSPNVMTVKRILPSILLLLVSGAANRAFAQVVDGKPIYEAHCRECHGVRGVPPQNMQVKYDRIATFNAAFIRKRSVDSVVKVLTRGKGLHMNSFKGKLTKDEMSAVAAYVRELADKAKS